jgi:hypothetical protein
MYRRSAWTGVILVALLVAFAAPAAAQVTPAKAVGPLVWTPSAVSQEAGRGDLAVMADFQMMHYSEESSKYGFGLGLKYGWCPTASIIVALNFNRFGYEGGGTTNTSFLGGAEYRFASESKVKPFVQGLVGVDHWGTNAFAIEPGAGIEYALNETFNLRVTAGIHIGFWDGNSSTGFRAGFGVSMPIKK